MPYAAPHPCTYPGCHELVRAASRCERHRRQEQHEYNRRRGGSTAQGYGSRWQAARKAFLAEHLFCRMCSRPERPVAATVVDHIIPHKGDMALFWDRSNWQPLCWRCHSRKTAMEDGRWGPKRGTGA